jgi:chromosome partitioning protein
MGLVIGKALQQLADRFEFVFIDCPPVLGVLMINALAASDHLLIPVQTEFLALKGLERMLRTLGMVTKARQLPLRYTIVPTMFDRRTRASLESLKALRERYPQELWQSVVPVDTQFREASRQAAPLSVINPRARGVAAYELLLQHLLEGERANPLASAVQ